MAWLLFLLFVAIPIAEIAVLIEAGDRIGLWPTVGLVILTAAVGAALARREGRAAMQRLAHAVENGQQPAGPLLDAAGVFAGGLLLLTPGFITDTLGLTLLFGPTRMLWGQIFAARRRRRGGGQPGAGDGFQTHRGPDPRNPNTQSRHGPVVIEAEYTEMTETKSGPDQPKGHDRNSGGGPTRS